MLKSDIVFKIMIKTICPVKLKFVYCMSFRISKTAHSLQKVKMLKLAKDIDISDYVLIVPSVSVGNVGQLATDLLICSLKMEKMAFYYGPAFAPVVGYNAYDLNSSSLTVSCELYVSPAHKIIALQIRSPLVNKYSKQFLEDLLEMSKSKKLKGIVILTSSFAHERHDMSTIPYRYMANAVIDGVEDFEALGWIKHGTGPIHGGGFAKAFFDLCSESGVPCLVIYKYCSEGDNISDAVDTLKMLNAKLNFLDTGKDDVQMIYPVSWAMLYGNPPPKEIY